MLLLGRNGERIKAKGERLKEKEKSIFKSPFRKKNNLKMDLVVM